MLKKPRKLCNKKDGMKGGYLGPQYTQEDCIERLKKLGAVFDILNDDELINKAAELLSDGMAIGWMNGRMEFGPRALGGRSILADPRSSTMQKQLNLKIKYRESFRPFAPSVLREDVDKWFKLDFDSPYMMLVSYVKQTRCREMTLEEKLLFGIEKINVSRSEIPAVTHVDNSARIQTVHKETNPKFHALISRFKELTGCPVIINTSFNVRGEPIVCTPEDAYRCFMGTELDCLVVGNLILLKKHQKEINQKDYRTEYALD